MSVCAHTIRSVILPLIFNRDAHINQIMYFTRFSCFLKTYFPSRSPRDEHKAGVNRKTIYRTLRPALKKPSMWNTLSRKLPKMPWPKRTMKSTSPKSPLFQTFVWIPLLRTERRGVVEDSVISGHICRRLT